MLLCSCSSRHIVEIEPPPPLASPSADDLLPTLGDPPAASAPIFASSDGLVSAPRPGGDSWECLEQLSRPPTPPVTVIKCRQRDSDERFFFLLAKDYEVAPERRLPVDAIIQDILPNTYEDLFERFEIRSVSTVEHQEAEGRELLIDALHPKLGPIRKRERLFVRGGHVLIVSAEGRPEFFDAFKAEIDAWIGGVVFLNLTLE